MTSPAETAVNDQIAAATYDATDRVLATVEARPDSQWVDHHPAEAPVLQQLADGLTDGTLTLCPHLPQGSPQPVIWSPGMNTLGCVLDYQRHAAEAQHRCHSCSEPVPRTQGMVMSQLGPVVVFWTACTDCREAPSEPMAAAQVAAAIPVIVDGLRQLWIRA